ncbi:hypothetical protein QYF36_025433 [Acer negundo]|nr:hypothetical protein QYF36_025433 [Acer negundo]
MAVNHKDSPKIRLRLRILELEKTDDGDELMIMPQGKTGDLSIESIPFQDADCSISVTVDGLETSQEFHPTTEGTKGLSEVRPCSLRDKGDELQAFSVSCLSRREWRDVVRYHSGLAKEKKRSSPSGLVEGHYSSSANSQRSNAFQVQKRVARSLCGLPWELDFPSRECRTSSDDLLALTTTRRKLAAHLLCPFFPPFIQSHFQQKMESESAQMKPNMDLDI